MEEQIFIEGKPSLKATIFNSSVLKLVFVWGFINAFLVHVFNKVRITSERIVWTHGLISQKSEMVELYRAKDINFEQSILARIFGVGIIKIASNDSSAPILSIPVEKPKEIQEKLRNAIKQQRKDNRVGVQELMS